MRFMLMVMMVTALFSSDLEQKVEALFEVTKKEPIRKMQYDPFFKANKVVLKVLDDKIVDDTIYIISILNSRVFVNSRWYGVGDMIGEYEIIDIRGDTVLAKKGGAVEKFGIRRVNKIIKIKD